jgi:integrase/recombinase XerD
MNSTKSPTPKTDFPSLLERYFCEYLLKQRNASPETVSSYRDTFRLFLQFSQQRFRKAPASLTLADLDAPQILAFLDTLESQRGNSVRSRNLRLAALRSFLRYAALQDPTAAASITRALAVPVKRFDRKVVSYLSREGITALLNAPNPSTWSGYRDGVMLATMYNTGARISEITKLNVEDLQFGPTTMLRIHGKGDKWRRCPLWPETVELLKQLETVRSADKTLPLLTSRQRRPLTRFGIYKIVKRHTVGLQPATSQAKSRSVSPHVFRHSIAVRLLEEGVDVNVIRGWLGHANLDTTHRYAEITLRMKQAAVATCLPPVETSETCRPHSQWRKDEDLMKWLCSL